ncbi:MAG: ACT domain-containing protein [Thermoproteota archaeon]|jgi:aspartokinase
MQKEEAGGKSVSEVVKNIIFSRPSILDCIKMDVINFSMVADLIAPEVEKEIGKKVNRDAIKMAVIRTREEVKKSESSKFEENIIKIIQNSKLELKNEISLITLDIHMAKEKLSKIVEVFDKSRFVQITQGVGSITITLDSDTYKEIKNYFDPKEIKEEISEQSAILLISPREIVSTPGVVSFIVDSLFREGINITQIVSCYTDTILIVSREDALRAYSVLEKLILKFRKNKIE